MRSVQPLSPGVLCIIPKAGQRMIDRRENYYQFMESPRSALNFFLASTK